MHRIETQFAGRPLIMETGRLAKQAAGSVFVQYGETALLVAVTVSNNISSLPFFPLTVEYREKQYAAGKIPGGFLKREGRPTDDEILACRVIDRSIRPLFPEGFKNEVQVFVTVLSTDQENDASVVALGGVSAALSISKMPWNGPIAAVRVGRVDGQWVLNPTFQQLDFSTLDLTVAGSMDSIQMVEGGALEISEAEVIEALKVAQIGIREQIKLQQEMIAKEQKPTMEWTPAPKDEKLIKKVGALAEKSLAKAMNAKDKAGRAAAISALRREVQEKIAEDFPDRSKEVANALEDVEYTVMREQILSKGERVDGRAGSDIRPISVDVGVLPRPHGSAVFTRGQTQALAVVTLGTADDEQRLDGINSAGQHTKSFMLHYNFPPYCTGEVKPMRGTSRREIGHGALAERALHHLLPDVADFPYTIRIVSEVLESNGSSSMATVCGGSLALMDAGVPMKAACAGVAMGMIKDGDRVAILTDILGTEDALGDMDFKVAGTAAGITSIQMDIKIDGMSLDLMKDALEQARIGRLHILGEMAKVLAEPRAEMSQWAPRIFTIQIKPDKIGDVIGPKGKTIRGIQDASGAKVNIDDTGLITIAAVGAEAGEKAREMVMGIVAEPIVGTIYTGPIKSITAFGAFIEIMPGVEGLLHISEIDHKRVEKTEDVLKKGETVTVKLLEVDERGRMRLSRKALLPKE
ncbi:MAG: polyribonucleotide nucleotidyltransferase [Gemmatimonadales bacterium]